MKNKLLLAVTLSAALVLSGCSASGGSAAAAPQETPLPAAVKTGIYGSVSTLPLMLGLSKAVTEVNGTEFDVSAAGKNASLAALSDGTSELAIFEGDASELPQGTEGKILAYEAVAVIVNPSCGVSNLTSAQITSIFTGESDDWADFGGNGRITIIMPEKGNTFRQVFEAIFSIRASANGIMRSLLPDTAVISSDTGTAVSDTAGAVGICPAASLESMEGTLLIDGVSLTDETLKDGTYPASQSVVFVIKQDASEDANAFYTYCASENATQLIQSNGYMPIT